MDTPWLKYHATFAPNLLMCALCGIGIALLWSPIPAVLFFVPIALGILGFLGWLERRRRRLLRESEPGHASQRQLADWQRFRAERRRDRPWFAGGFLVLIALALGILPVSVGSVLFAAGLAVGLLDLLFVAPWLYADIELRIRQDIE